MHIGKELSYYLSLSKDALFPIKAHLHLKKPVKFNVSFDFKESQRIYGKQCVLLFLPQHNIVLCVKQHPRVNIHCVALAQLLESHNNNKIHHHESS